MARGVSRITSNTLLYTCCAPHDDLCLFILHLAQPGWDLGGVISAGVNGCHAGEGQLEMDSGPNQRQSSTPMKLVQDLEEMVVVL